MKQFEKGGTKIFCLKTCCVTQAEGEQNSTFMKYNDLEKKIVLLTLNEEYPNLQSKDIKMCSLQNYKNKSAKNKDRVLHKG